MGTMKETSTGRVVDQLRALILDGDLLPGERLRQEELAEQLGASRVPIREALRVLAGRGLVRLVANTGAWVSSLTHDECVELYRVRERLEPLLLEQSLPGLREAELQEIDVARRAVDECRDVREFIALDRRFHSLTYQAAPDGYVKREVGQLWDVTQHYRRRFTEMQDDRGRALIASEHGLLVDALMRGDSVAAVAVLEMHIRRTRLALQHAVHVFDS
ncbi:GntR family transcriptional regulator [Pseudoclavibacter sp. CFCC 13796]|uniref:GntR family transcriptional regulator n=1 Tax=unclassified Pseudoclavibacter TaxID=2615177 RepID=UPI0013018F46|nr:MULTISPECIES: GntR family transcriptional regulator [unclassified Pseudoclavibacter]KAB1661070.1 GntR family transcriptional regulator [Pseudoclavibacter sp. CFCC 13796]